MSNVHTLQKDVLQIQVHNALTMLEVKNLVAKRLELQPSQLRMIFAGIGLVNEYTLCWYRIRDQDIIHLIVVRKRSTNEPTETSSTVGMDVEPELDWTRIQRAMDEASDIISKARSMDELPDYKILALLDKVHQLIQELNVSTHWKCCDEMLQ